MTNDEPQFGIDDCTRIPFTRQTNPPRYLNRPTDTVDMISGWERGRDCPHHAPVVPVSSPPPDQTAEPVCQFEEGCHRVVPCDPGCAVAVAELYHRLAAVPPPPAGRVAVLREAADGFDRHAEQILEGVGDKAVFVAKALRDQAAVWREAAESLRRLAVEAQQPEAPWATDSARIGRVLIWSHAQVGRSDFGQGYRTAQEDVRAILTRPLLAAAAEAQQPEPESGCAHCGSSDHVWDNCEAYTALVRDEAPDAPQPPAHIGGNADDCPACQAQGLHTIGHPYECPGPETAARGEETNLNLLRDCECGGSTPHPDCPVHSDQRAVCVCGHTRGEHIRVGGPFGKDRLLCDACDPDNTDNLTCEEFEAL